jgi:hypothetical protein
LLLLKKIKKEMDSERDMKKSVFKVPTTVFVINAIWKDGNGNLKLWFEKKESGELK